MKIITTAELQKQPNEALNSMFLRVSNQRDVATANLQNIVREWERRKRHPQPILK